MKPTTLVIMAAGIGSRFGTGIKQIAPVGPSGEIIIDYSIHDAIEAGFNKVVFIIRHDIEADFREAIGTRAEQKIDVDYVFQELSDLPPGFSAGDHTKPWGTGQAILACRGTVTEPFAVINADDYYGKHCFTLLHDFLVSGKTETTDKLQCCMAGFQLKNTLSDFGTVTRGVCHVKDGYLTAIQETKGIEKVDGKAAVRTEDGFRFYEDQTPVSMNMWGFSPDFIDALAEGFPAFLSGLSPEDKTSEYLLPIVIGEYIQNGNAQVAVLPTDDKWFGMTYQEDIPLVRQAFRELVDEGAYPDNIR